MAKTFVIGRITDELELKYSEKNVPYVRFTLMEFTGEANGRPQFYEVWAYYNNAENLIKQKVGKDSLIQVTGTLLLEVFLRKDGHTEDKRLKVNLDSWNFISKKLLQN